MVTLVVKLNLPTYHRKLLAAGRSKSDRKHQPYFSTNCRCNTRALAVGLPGVPMSRCSNVQASVSPSVPISRRSNVQASVSPSVPISRRSNVRASGSSSAPISRRSNVQEPQHPDVPAFRRSNVQASGSSSVPMSRRCNISACGCPDTCTSQSPHAQAAQHRDFQGSEPPRPQTPQVQTTTTSVSPGPKTPRPQGPPHWTDFRQGLKVSQAKDAVKHGPGSATVSMTPNARSPERLGLNFPAPRGFCVPLRGCVRNPVQAGWSLFSMRWIMAT